MLGLGFSFSRSNSTVREKGRTNIFRRNLGRSKTKKFKVVQRSTLSGNQQLSKDHERRKHRKSNLFRHSGKPLQKKKWTLISDSPSRCNSMLFALHSSSNNLSSSNLRWSSRTWSIINNITSNTTSIRFFTSPQCHLGRLVKILVRERPRCSSVFTFHNNISSKGIILRSFLSSSTFKFSGLLVVTSIRSRSSNRHNRSNLSKLPRLVLLPGPIMAAQLCLVFPPCT